MSNRLQWRIHKERIPLILMIVFSAIGGAMLAAFGISTRQSFFTYFGIVLLGIGWFLAGVVFPWFVRKISKTEREASKWAARGEDVRIDKKLQFVRGLTTFFAYLPCGIVITFLSAHNIPVLVISFAFDIIVFFSLAVLLSNMQKRKRMREGNRPASR